MTNPSASDLITDAKLDNFEQRVVVRSREAPVMVDFWAPWCAPCQMLAPVLMKLAMEYQGKFLLVKVNTDDEKQIAQRFGIRSLPTVKVFRNGQIVDEFFGAQPESVIRDIVERHILRESDGILYNAMVALRGGKIDEALALLDQAARMDPKSDRVKMTQARFHVQLGHIDAAESALKGLSATGQSEPEAVAIGALLFFARQASGIAPPDELVARITRNENDLPARYALATHQILTEQYEDALDNLLYIVRRDRKFEADAGRKAMIRTFDLLGGGDELVKRYRGQLASLLN